MNGTCSQLPAPHRPEPLGPALDGRDDTLDVLELRAAPRLTPSPPLPTGRLADPPRLADPASPPVRRFRLAKYTINDKTMDMDRIDLRSPRAPPKCGR